MGTAGTRLIHDVEPVEVAADLDRLYCYEPIESAVPRAVVTTAT